MNTADKSGPTPISYDRRVSEDFLDVFRSGGPLRPLIHWVLEDRTVRDVQLRRLPGKNHESAAFYIGMTVVLEIQHRVKKGWRISKPHKSHVEIGKFDLSWIEDRRMEDFAALTPDFLRYLARVPKRPDFTRHTGSEGTVHAMLAAGGRQFSSIDREAVIAGIDSLEATTQLRQRLFDQLIPAPPDLSWWSERPLPLGTGVDFIGVDADGTVLVIEAKHAGDHGKIPWAPLQVMFYAELFRRWLSGSPEAPAILNRMLESRISLDLCPDPGSRVEASAQVTPIVAIGPGRLSPEVLSRARHVNELLPQRTGLPSAKFWRLSYECRVHEVRG